MAAEKPYDTIPNFTAADALRLTGIGRNEFLDIMNKCRAKVWNSKFTEGHNMLSCALTGNILSDMSHEASNVNIICAEANVET